MEIGEDDPASPALAALMARHVRESRAVSPPENAHVLEPHQLAREKVTFWTARERGAVAGMVALKQLERPACGVPRAWILNQVQDDGCRG